MNAALTGVTLIGAAAAKLSFSETTGAWGLRAPDQVQVGAARGAERR